MDILNICALLVLKLGVSIGLCTLKKCANSDREVKVFLGFLSIIFDE